MMPAGRANSIVHLVELLDWATGGAAPAQWDQPADNSTG
jgi:hypothetical protein